MRLSALVFLASRSGLVGLLRVRGDGVGLDASFSDRRFFFPSSSSGIQVSDLTFDDTGQYA